MERSIEVLGKLTPEYRNILNSEALEFIAELARRFNPTREALLLARAQRQREILAGTLPDFLAETASVRSGDWQVGPVPADLQDRRVEITGPVERKMMINALNSGAKVFMADFEDALSPTWDNVVGGQINLIDAVRKTIEFQNPDGRMYRLNPEVATLLVRPRGWHLSEHHVRVDGKSVPGSLFDFGLYLFHNGRELLNRGSGPYYYLPKLESHMEARLWNEVMDFSEQHLGLPHGSIKATVLIETILAAFEMEEILYELKDHIVALNAGRWDYIFSAIKKFRNRPDFVLPDRAQVTMTVPFMRAYTELLVQTCHRRGAHAIGGMAAFIPSRKDPEVNRVAITKVHEDKQREASDGFDGTWVAHPDLVPVAMEDFDRVLGPRPNQKERLRAEVQVSAQQILDIRVPGGTITEAGLRNNVSVGLQYLNSWLAGNGAAGIYNLMEDAATCEISRAQIWQWIKNESRLEDGRLIDAGLYQEICAQELEKLGGASTGHYATAREILDELVLTSEFVEFLTLIAYEELE